MDTRPLSGPEGQSCWIRLPSVGNPVNLQERLFRGETLSSHLNIYSQPAALCRQTLPHSPRLPSPFIHCLRPSFSSPLALLIWDALIHCLPQEVFLRPTQLSVTTTGSAAKRKCSGWGHCRMQLRNFSVSSWCAARWKATLSCFLCGCSLACFYPSCSRLFFPSWLLYSCLFQDVDTIYHSQDNREFNLLDFSHLDSRWHTLFQTSGMIPNMQQLKFGCWCWNGKIIFGLTFAKYWKYIIEFGHGCVFR